MDKEYLIFHTAMESNILPITSVCDTKCIFCSHKDNPTDIRVISIPHRSLEEIEMTINF